MPVPNVAPDYIPDDLKKMYNIFSAEGKEQYIIEFENEYAPKAGTLITPEAVTTDPNRDPFSSFSATPAQQAELKRTNDTRMSEANQRRDPFSSITATPAQRAELKRTEDRRMGLQAGVLEERAKKDVEGLAVQQQEQAINKLLTGDPITFYDTIIEKGVIKNFDPAMEQALKRADRDIYRVLSEEETKAYRVKLLMELDKGVDPMTAQQNAFVQIQEIKRAERVASGFTSPPVKSGDTRMIDPSFGQGAQPTLGEAFGRQVYKTSEQVGQEKIRRGEADRIKSQLYAMFANQAVGEFASQGVQPTNQEVVARANQLESDYVQGKLLTNFVMQSRDDYLRATGMNEDEFRASPKARNEASELANYLYNDFVFNIYPEYSGAEPEEPSFLKEVMTDVGDEGALVESRTGQALRGLGGLIRPVTEAVSDVISYEVVTDPVTGEVTYPEGTPLPLQQPMNVTKERSEMSYGDLIASDIAGGRFLGEDYAQMPQLTAALGDEGAMILGLVTEIGLPVTPVGMVAPLAKGTAVGARLAGGSAELASKLLEKTGLDKAALVASKGSDLGDGLDKHLRRLAEVADAPMVQVSDALMESRVKKLRRDMDLTPDLIDNTIKKVAKEVNDMVGTDDVDKFIRTQELLEDLGRLQSDMARNVDGVYDAGQGLRKNKFPAELERGLTDALTRVGAELKPEARAVFNDIMSTHKIMNNISNAPESTIRQVMSASNQSPYFRKVVQATMLDMLKNGDTVTRTEVAAYLTGRTTEISEEFAVKISGHLGQTKPLRRVKEKVIEDYISDYTFNMLPENYIFISPKAVISNRAYRKFGSQVMEESNEFVQRMNPKIVGDEIYLTLDDVIAEEVRTLLRKNYGMIAKSKMFQDLLVDVKAGTLKVTQEEFNFIHGAIKEQNFARIAGDSYITPQRATLDAIKRADVPLPRRKELARIVRTIAREVVLPNFKKTFDTNKIGYSKASQYGLARALQSMEQEFSNFTLRLQQKTQRSLAANNGNVEASLNSLLFEAKKQMGYADNQQMYFNMIKRTFDTQGISDDVLTSFIFNRVNNESLDFVGDFNKLYDEFVASYPSKEAGTLGGKIFEKKNTAVTFVETIAEGEKQAITKRIYADMEATYPDLFFRMPEVQPSKGIPFESAQPRAMLAKYQDSLDELAKLKNQELGPRVDYLNDSPPVPPVEIIAPNPRIRLPTPRPFRGAENNVIDDLYMLNESIDRTVVTAIAPSEINAAALAEQKRYINAMISDLYEGSDEAIRYAYGELAMEGQGFLGGNVARALITPKNIKKIKNALMIDEATPASFKYDSASSTTKNLSMKPTDGKGKRIPYPRDMLEDRVGLITDDFKAFARSAGIEEGDELYGQLIMDAYQRGNFQALNEITGLKPMQLMYNLETVGFPTITSKYNFESLRPMIHQINPERAVLASTKDIEMLKALKEKSLEGTLGKSIDVLSRKSDSLGSYALSSAGYAIMALNQSIKGGMLGGVFAPTGKYLTVNSVTAPFIMAYTSPSIMGATFGKLLKTGGAVVANPMLAAFKTAAQAGTVPSTTMGLLGGAFAGGFAAGPAGALAGAVGGAAMGKGFTMAGSYIETILKASGNGRMTDILSTFKPESAALRTIDGRIFTQGEMLKMLERNNIMFSQVNFEFGQSAYNTMIRQMGIGATGNQVGHVRNATRWLRPDRPNFWNTIALETDNAFRTQVFADALYLGYTEKQAAEFARRSLLDYSDMSKAEQKYIAQYFLFYSFMRQSFVEVAGAFAKGDNISARNIVAAVRFGQEQKKITKTDELFIDQSYKSKAMASIWTQLGESYDKTMTLHYGPAFPSTESFMQLANVYFFMYDAGFSEYEVEGGVVNTLTETLILKGNPVLQQILQQGSKKFRSANAPHGVVPVREVIALKSSGMFPIAEAFFELEPIPPDEMSAGRPTYPVDGQESGIQYRIGSKAGSKNYLIFKVGLLTSGLDRGVQDWAANTAEKLEAEGVDMNGAKLKRYSDGSYALEVLGLATPIAVPNYYVQRDRKIKQIVKELRAEQD